MITAILKGISRADAAGLTQQQLKKETRRSPFSKYLPYTSYDPQSQTYINQDKTLGLIWECDPLTFANDDTAKILESLLKIGLPDKSVIQFILYPDPYLDPVLEHYRRIKKRDNPLVAVCAREFTRFLKEGAQGVKALSGIPTRNFRLLIAVKVPKDGTSKTGWDDIRANFYENLLGVKVHPRPFAPEDLLDLTRRLFNEEPGDNARHYDWSHPIRNQIIYGETNLQDQKTGLKIGERYFRAMTPKNYPQEVNPFQTNQLAGGVWGIISDADQIKTPFLLSVNVIIEDLKGKLENKANIINGQGAAGSFAQSLNDKKEEMTWAMRQINRGTQFVRIMPVLWVWGSSPEITEESATRAKRVWEQQGYVIQKESRIQKILFIASLPFGLYLAGRNLENIQRDTITSTAAAARILPVQADFSGGGDPALLFVGRKGQICTLDIFSKDANNHNFMVAAESGGGKSFNVNFLTFNYWAMGTKVRLIDMGYSYEKMCRLAKGKYIDIGPGTNLGFNPFSNIFAEDEEELAQELETVEAVLAQMAFSNTNGIPSEVQRNLINTAVQYAWQKEGQEAEVNTVYNFLSHFPKAGAELLGGLVPTKSIIEQAHELAFNLRDFTPTGKFGAIFKGPSNFNIAEEDFVVLELERLRTQKQLFRVLTLQVLNAVTQDLYLGDRSVPSLIVFDEGPQVLEEGGPMFIKVLEGGYRRARKYYGGIGVILQSILDQEKFGIVGDVIKDNSAFKFYLESKAFAKASQKGLIDYDEFTLEILRKLKTKKGSYSEIFADTPWGQGALRLVVDPFFYGICTSDPKENKQIEALIQSGKTEVEAIYEFGKTR